jgi:uncharacterized Ntn-hydrolase superfamily protein
MKRRWVLAAGAGVVSILVLSAWLVPYTIIWPSSLVSAAESVESPAGHEALPVSTFSIVAFDPDTGDLGVAVESKFFAVGPVVPFAAAGAGAIATQSYANTSYGPRGLEMLREGMVPDEVIAALTESDEGRQVRQVGIVDAHGGAATFTGDSCLSWAGGRTGPGYAVQGNILAGPAVVDAMAESFEATGGDLATRLVAALAAGQAAGGDARGRQSAALLVVREGGGYGGYNDRYIDLRVDDHPTPIAELQRLLDIRHSQIIGSEAQSSMRAAAAARGDQRLDLLLDARAALREVVRLNPADGWSQLWLANAHLQLGQEEEAAAAGIQALRIDPWIKKAALAGISGGDRLVEPLLGLEEFRKIWETLPSER